MSRFIDKLKQASQTELPPLGFGRVHNIVKPKMLLLAQVEAGAAKTAGEADAVLLKDNGKKSADTGDIPCGVLLEQNSKLKDVAETGADFVAFPPEAELEAIEDEDTGKVLVIETSLEKELLRAINDMPVDAVILTGEKTEPLDCVWRSFMLCKITAALCGKPLLVKIAADTGENKLQLLWEAGIAGVVIEAGNAKELKEMRSVIDSLKPPSKKKGKNMAIVPLMREEPVPVAGEETEEETEEDI